jgi:acetyl esterase/lipase
MFWDRLRTALIDDRRSAVAVPTELPTDGPGPRVDAEIPRRASVRLRIAHAILHATVRRFFAAAVWIDDRRLVSPRVLLLVARTLEPILAPLRPARGTRLRRVPFANFRAEWVWDRGIADPADVRDAAIVYFHGGGLVACGLNSHRRLVARIARTAGMPLLNVDYRQIPRAHVTETLDDCVEAYEYLLAQGFQPDRIVVAGDSAGGGLAFALALAARERGLPMPAGIAAIAPWVDYDSAIRLAHPNDRADAVLPARAYALPVKWGMQIDGNLNPAWSPINSHFAGLPPALIQVASTEVLRPDAERLAQRCAEAGVPVTLQIWDNAFHVFQVSADFLPDARDAVEHIGTFIRNRVDAAEVPEWTKRTSA